ncbi:unnamed protein product [Macrosiphum euphorbiae]|uniref:Uncharacterized protein n=1 Tax=Macrosiphum euphorbiae TaxID=13131 RepID=A0AAV0Y726_9HEMI|nr:unnamed protein product [Macrosiphum euphorbiae]
MDINTLLQQNRFSVFSLGAFLGPDVTEEQRIVSGKQGEIIFSYFSIIPNEFDVPECRCGRPMYRVIDSSRKLGYRFKCADGHRMNPTKNTFFEYVHVAGELGRIRVQ